MRHSFSVVAQISRETTAGSRHYRQRSGSGSGKVAISEAFYAKEKAWGASLS